MKPNRITISRSARGTTIKATGHAAQRLFDALTKGPQKLPVQGFQACTVHLADQGQGFLEVDVDSTGTVSATRPCEMKWLIGCELREPPKVGALLSYRGLHEGLPRCVSYPVTKVVQRIEPPAAPG